MKRNNRHESIKRITRLAMFIAIEAIVCFVPFLGSIQIGPVVATLAMIPVIIVGMTYGILYGSILGAVAGLFSFIWWTFIDSSNPSAMLFTPWNAYTTTYRNYWPLVICFVPRILTGTVAGGLSSLFSKIMKTPTGQKKIVTLLVNVCVGIISSLVNTILVLFGTYLLWGKKYAELSGIEFDILLKTIMTIVLTNGLFEALVGGIVGSSVTLALKTLKA